MKLIDYQPDAVILANGEYPTHPLALQLLAEAPYVVCCDGAADAYIGRGYVPDAIIGDGDSLSSENKLTFAHLLHHNPDQETNDQTKAVQFLIEEGKRALVILGATGKREDHTLGNISLLMEYYRMGVQVRMVTDYGIFIPAHNTQTFVSVPGQQISIFNFGATELRGEGLIYPLSDFGNWWQGTLNEARDTLFTIHCQGDYLIFRTHPTNL
ncbi:MAG: thiamine diphosphokinase [Bacteroidia bacterium]|nr:thiamine diphosphokinase [Bacteroidia bacterium]